MKTLKTLTELIAPWSFTYVSSLLTPENFPPQEIRKGTLKFIRPGRSFTSEEALEMIKKEGVPLNVYELLHYKDEIQKELKPYEWCLAFGQTPLIGGYHRVPDVYRYSGGVFLFDYGDFERPWDGGLILVLLCDLQKQDLGSSDTLEERGPLDTLSPDTKAIVGAIEKLIKEVAKLNKKKK